MTRGVRRLLLGSCRTCWMVFRLGYSIVRFRKVLKMYLFVFGNWFILYIRSKKKIEPSLILWPILGFTWTRLKFSYGLPTSIEHFTSHLLPWLLVISRRDPRRLRTIWFGFFGIGFQSTFKRGMRGCNHVQGGWEPAQYKYVTVRTLKLIWIWTGALL